MHLWRQNRSVDHQVFLGKERWWRGVVGTVWTRWSKVTPDSSSGVVRVEKIHSSRRAVKDLKVMKVIGPVAKSVTVMEIDHPCVTGG